MKLKLDRTTDQARAQAAAILAVLAGARTPTDAAKSLSLSLPAYYKLESRALRGLVLGCQPPARGPTPSPEVEVQRLRRQCQRLQQDVGRYQALARAAQRAAGLAASPATPPTDARGRRRRKPSVRALKAINALRQPPEPVPVAATPVAPQEAPGR
jgi:hypothetical protein